jgi:radical SAM superfamily enzyme YgiQ (UPF0313 family)
MKKKIYIIQPTYRKMDGGKVKGWSLFNHSILLPIFSSVIPADWEKEICLEYFDDVNFDSDASVIIITCTGYDIMHSLDIARTFKDKNKIVIFGAHMDDFSDKILNNVCDSVFYGYPSPVEMVSLLKDVICNNLLPQYNFGMNINYPFDYSVLNGKKMPVIQVQASAGCRNHCNYCCATPPAFSGKYKLRKLDYVIKDLKEVSKMTKYVSFIDANIYNNPKFIKLLCRKMIDEKIKFTWGAQTTVDIADDHEALKLLHDSGCRILFIGLESVEQKNICFLDKPYKTSEYSARVLRIKKAGIHVAGYFMLGMDYDTDKSSNAIYRFVHDSNISLPVINVLMPVPGTRLFNILKIEGRMLVENINEFLKQNPLYSVPCQIPFFIPKEMTADELTVQYLTLVRRLYRYREILKRSIVPNISEAVKIMVMNLELRKKYYLMKKSIR